MKFKGKTVGGYDVEILATDLSGQYPIGGVMTDQNGQKQLMSWMEDGGCYGNGNPHKNNLIPVQDYSEFKKGDLCWLGKHRSRIGFFSHAYEGRPCASFDLSSSTTEPYDHCEKVFQPLSDDRIAEIWSAAGPENCYGLNVFARLIEKEVMKQVKK